MHATAPGTLPHSMPDPSSLSPALLPIADKRAVIDAALDAHQVIIVCGETGSGKTTQLPQYCLDRLQASRSPGLIGHTQPRRLAARAVASRIAEELGEPSGVGGGTVGVKIRFQDYTSRNTRIKLMTDGILLAELSSDPDLRAYSILIIDEAHERSLNIDFLLGYLRTLLPRRPDLKLIITSATIDTARFSNHFGGPARAPVIEVSGRTFPVEIRYRPFSERDDEPDRINYESLADAVDSLVRPGAGDVLVFLPGEREIRQASDAVTRMTPEALVLPLYSRLTDQQQDLIFHPDATGRGRTRVILATNVAETSLTVPGIRYVVDTGVARLSRYDPERKVQRLPIEPVSQASANQRSGRCGRVAAGICIRLYSEDSYRERPRFTDPEIRRTSLASVILRMKSLGGRLTNVEDFPFLDPPDARAIHDGYETLFELGAITSADRLGTLTPIGERMSRIPLDPRVARLLLGAEPEGALEELIILAAALSIQDPRERPMSRQDDADRAHAVFRDETSDLLSLLKLWDQYSHSADTMGSGALAGWCRQLFVSAPRMREWGDMIRQLRDIAQDLGLARNTAPASNDAIHRALLTGLISNVACREGDGSFDYRGVRDNVVQLFPGSVLFKKGPKWIMAAEVVHTTRLYARTVARIDPAWIEELAGHMFRRQISDRHLDRATGQPSAWERVQLSSIVVVPRRQISLAPIDPAGARNVFIREALAQTKWETDAPFMQHNRDTLERARAAEAKLRRRDVLVDEGAIVEWFDRRVPAQVVDPETFEAWRADAEKRDPRILMLSLPNLIQPAARHALDPAVFPDEVLLASDDGPVACPLEFSLAPGKDEDGVTLTVPLTLLPAISTDRPAWLVPGLLPSLVHALLKTLPKNLKAPLEAKADLAQLAASSAEVLPFAEGSLAAALSETVEVLFGLKVPPEQWNFKGLPPHLRLRVRVIDENAKQIAVERDLGALMQRLAGRITKTLAARTNATVERHNLTTWSFGDLPDLASLPAPVEGSSVSIPTLADRTGSVSFLVAKSVREAAITTHQGLRRLFALACQDELKYYVEPLPQWGEIVRHYAQLGSEAELKNHLAARIAERTYMEGQPPIRTRAAFEERLARNAGRLPQVSREMCELALAFLEPRARVSKRLSGGISRLWADSVADMREQAAYLMPAHFLLNAPLEQLRHYPRFVGAMADRLFSLRDDGMKANLDLMKQFAPHWKRLTGWVAVAMTTEREARERDQPGEPAAAKPPSGKPPLAKSPLPQSRRAAPTVNLDAGDWAMQPGNLPPPVEQYRWALEHLRVALFVPTMAAPGAPSIAEIERLWSLASESGSSTPTTKPQQSRKR